jgi:hypothetical protein
MLGNLRPCALHNCLPFVRDSSFKSFDPSILDCVMKTAFGDEIFCSLTDVTYNTKASNMARLPRKNTHESVSTEWPQLISDDVKLRCMQDYFNHTVWKKPLTCAVCARDCYGVSTTTYELKHETELPPGFRGFLSISCQSMLYNSNQFVFGHPAIDNMMLCLQGILHGNDSTLKIIVCRDCSTCVDPKSHTTPPRLPKYVLTNKLFLGDCPLPHGPYRSKAIS